MFEEYLIIDSVSMVGSIGGTLGLCIGFSFYDFFQFLWKVVGFALCKMTGSEAKRHETFKQDDENLEDLVNLVDSLRIQLEKCERRLQSWRSLEHSAK